MAHTTYAPPAAADIAKAQNADPNLKLMLAQRRFYSRAKRWAGIRGIGTGIIAVAAPLLAAFVASAAVPAATTAAIWYVLSRVLFRHLERRDATRGASVQEQFDTAIFGMPPIAVREPRVLPEDVTRIVGTRRRRAYAVERLRNWYPIQEGVPGRIAIAIAQRANVSYTRRLLERHATLWLWVLVGWSLVAVIISLLARFSLATFLLAVAIPVLPPLVDAWDEYVSVRAASREREALANEIHDAIAADAAAPISPEHLVAWQSQLFALRRDAPLVPDWLYGLLRRGNEAEMSEAAETIGRTAQQEEGN